MSLFPNEDATPVAFTDQDACDCGQQSGLRTGTSVPAERSHAYAGFYSALGALREEFHRIGRFDDANAKLDELCKLLVLKVLDTRHPDPNGRSRLGLQYLSGLAQRRHGNPGRLAAALHDVFDEMAALFPDELQVLGLHRGLNIRIDDDDFARALVPLLESMPAEANDDPRWSFDAVSEAFGHFIQDTFRNRKEDAQYMTPPEVVSAVVDIAFFDILQEIGSDGPAGRLLVADPTCGVGTFLAAAYRHAAHIELAKGRLCDYLMLFGQDKVERMVHLATANLKVFARAEATVRLGNSIIPSSALDDIAGKVDLIITNPPFGASFDATHVLSTARPEHFPVLRDLASANALPGTIDSEYLLLDREVSLLKPCGRLLMVVPDHVVSGQGFSEAFRLALLRYADLVAVIDLPAETFAQAGTRTKTSVVYLRRPLATGDRWRPRQVFMAVSEDLGFRVISRKGASVKKIEGESDLSDVVEAYRAFRSKRRQLAGIVCFSHDPSTAAVPKGMLLNNRWTARSYRSDRLSALHEIDLLAERGFTAYSLADLAEVDPESGERVLPDSKNRCISILHLRENGCIDLQAVDDYRPSTPCVRCRPGDVLLSKINPRILRICVVPQTPWDLGCSPEFAVLRAKLPGLSPWELALLLRSRSVQLQLTALSSGTSSSHNRIKDRDLLAVRVPVPRPGTTEAKQVSALARRYERAAKDEHESLYRIAKCFAELKEIFPKRLESGV